MTNGRLLLQFSEICSFRGPAVTEISPSPILHIYLDAAASDSHAESLPHAAKIGKYISLKGMTSIAITYFRL